MESLIKKNKTNVNIARLFIGTIKVGSIMHTKVNRYIKLSELCSDLNIQLGGK